MVFAFGGLCNTNGFRKPNVAISSPETSEGREINSVAGGNMASSTSFGGGDLMISLLPDKSEVIKH